MPWINAHVVERSRDRILPPRVHVSSNLFLHLYPHVHDVAKFMQPLAPLRHDAQHNSDESGRNILLQGIHERSSTVLQLECLAQDRCLHRGDYFCAL